MSPEEHALIEMHAKTDAMERVNMRMRVTELETVLSALVTHWRAGDSLIEMEDLIDRAKAALRKRQ